MDLPQTDPFYTERLVDLRGQIPKVPQVEITKAKAELDDCITALGSLKMPTDSSVGTIQNIKTTVDEYLNRARAAVESLREHLPEGQKTTGTLKLVLNEHGLNIQLQEIKRICTQINQYLASLIGLKLTEQTRADFAGSVAELKATICDEEGALTPDFTDSLNGKLVAASNQTPKDTQGKTGKGPIEISINQLDEEEGGQLRILFYPLYPPHMKPGARPYAVSVEITMPRIGIVDPLTFVVRESAMTGNEIKIISNSFPLHCELGDDPASQEASQAAQSIMFQIVKEIAEMKDAKIVFHNPSMEAAGQQGPKTSSNEEPATYHEITTTRRPDPNKDYQAEIEVLGTGLSQKLSDPDLWLQIAKRALEGHSYENDLTDWVPFETPALPSAETIGDRISLQLLEDFDEDAPSKKPAKLPIRPRSSKPKPTGTFVDLGEIKLVTKGERIEIEVRGKGLYSAEEPTNDAVVFRCTGQLTKNEDGTVNTAVINIPKPKKHPRFKFQAGNMSNVPTIWIKAVAMMTATFRTCGWTVNIQDEVPSEEPPKAMPQATTTSPLRTPEAIRTQGDEKDLKAEDIKITLPPIEPDDSFEEHEAQLENVPSSDEENPCPPPPSIISVLDSEIGHAQDTLDQFLGRTTPHATPPALPDSLTIPAIPADVEQRIAKFRGDCKTVLAAGPAIHKLIESNPGITHRQAARKVGIAEEVDVEGVFKWLHARKARVYAGVGKRMPSDSVFSGDGRWIGTQSSLLGDQGTDVIDPFYLEN